MIQVSRLPAPAYLNSVDVDRWHYNLCLRRATYYRELSQALQNNQTKPKRPSADGSHYRHPDVLAQLKTMFGSKCAYCEGNVEAVSPQHVEHYRPASRYPGLAYEWENLLLACPHCNSTYKKDKFPISPTGNTPRENHTHPCSRTGNNEAPLLLNPYIDNPDQHLTFRNGRIVALSRQGRFTRRICGLNRDGLLRSRRRQLRYIRFFAEHYKFAVLEDNQPDIAKYAGELKEIVNQDAPYAAMARTELTLLGIYWRNF